MLYDPKWEVEVKADPFSLESLIAWLETMPIDKSYNYMDCDGRCLLGQYGSHVGARFHKFTRAKFDSSLGKFRDLVYEQVASDAPHTFGAALDRARTALAKS